MPQAPRMGRKVSDYSFWEDTALPYLKDVASGKIAEEGMRRMGKAAMSGDFGDFIPGGGFGITKLRGQLPPLWHGVKDAFTREPLEGILNEGFTRGQSAELRLPGTSASYDPLVSAQLFSPHPWKKGRNKLEDYLLRVKPTKEPKGLLSPSEYVAGVTPGPDELYMKPQHFFGESEVFGERFPGSVLQNELLKTKELLLEEIEVAKNLGATKIYLSSVDKLKNVDEQLKKIYRGDVLDSPSKSPFYARPITEREAQYVRDLGDRYVRMRESIHDYNPGIGSPYYKSPKEFVKEFTDINRKAPSMFRGSLDGWRANADQVFSLLDPASFGGYSKGFADDMGSLFKSAPEASEFSKRLDSYEISKPLKDPDFAQKKADLRNYSRTHGRPKSIEDLPQNLRKVAKDIDAAVFKNERERYGLIKYLESLANR